MTILDSVEDSLREFRPKTHRQFVAFNIARQFNDLGNLARYLNVCGSQPKKVLLEAARLAQVRASDDRRNIPEVFFELLADWSREDRP